MKDWFSIFSVELKFVSVLEHAENILKNLKEAAPFLVGRNNEHFDKTSHQYLFIMVRTLYVAKRRAQIHLF
jgi:hypothetical protein